MKKLILTVMAAGLVVLSVRAQEIPERKKEPVKPFEKERLMARKERASLNLTEEQKARLKSLNQDLRQKMEELRKQDNLTVKVYREKMEALRNERQTQFQSILTPEQKADMEKLRKGREERMKDMGERRNARMKEELKLTDEQSRKLAENRKATAEKMKAIRENKALSEEQKKEQVKETMKKQKENMRSILTEEQLQKMKQNRKQHHGMKRRPEVI